MSQVHPPSEPYTVISIEPEENPFIEQQRLQKITLLHNTIELPNNDKKRVVFCLLFLALMTILIIVVLKQNNTF